MEYLSLLLKVIVLMTAFSLMILAWTLPDIPLACRFSFTLGAGMAVNFALGVFHRKGAYQRIQ